MKQKIKLTESQLHKYVKQYINEWFKEPSEPRKALICQSIIDFHKANEIANAEGLEEEWLGAQSWFEGIIDYDTEFELQDIPKHSRFIMHMDYVDADLYCDYGAGYYFAVRKSDETDMAMSENKIRLSENDLHKMIKESIKEVLTESYNEYGVWKLIDELKEVMSAEDILNRLIARISPIEARNMLEDILSVENPDYDEEY